MWCRAPEYRNVRYKLLGVASLNIAMFSASHVAWRPWISQCSEWTAWCDIPEYRNVPYKLRGVMSLNIMIFSIILITFVTYTVLEWSVMEDKLGDVSVRLSSCYCFLLKDVVNCEHSVTWVIEEWMCTQHSWIDTEEGVAMFSENTSYSILLHQSVAGRTEACCLTSR